MKAFVTEIDDCDLKVCIPLEGNTFHLCFDIDKYGCLGEVPRVITGPFIRRAFHREIRIPDELVLNVRTVAEVAKATEPLLRKVIEGMK
ncbi:MAG TPA: hypothetical protein VM680_10320 [Verrucomicrobiae bacterium]|nr:hypothetical protein [Verrucomicrobiae bacterium]